MTYLDGLAFAVAHGYVVKEYTAPFKSFSCIVDDTCAIALNHELLLPGEETTVLFHELGHCETRSFYNHLAAADVRQRHENHADKWAIEMLVPQEQLEQAIASGYSDIWELAELFGVTEDFMRKAVCLYTHGNLDVDFYFPKSL